MKPKNMLLTLDTCLEQEKTGRKTGLLVTALMNGLMLVLSLPFMDWIQLVNIPKLFAKLGITREAAGSLYSSYSIFSLLEGLSQQQRGRWEGRASYLCDRKGLDTSDSTSGVWLLRFCPVFQQCGENEGLFRIVDPGS